jgi:hypothetical protein
MPVMPLNPSPIPKSQVLAFKLSDLKWHVFLKMNYGFYLNIDFENISNSICQIKKIDPSASADQHHFNDGRSSSRNCGQLSSISTVPRQLSNSWRCWLRI